MDLHLVGGFLGSGKTTGIIAACHRLTAEGKTVGVVTNDQGKYLVDTAFFEAADLPTVEVTGGCFCCRYEDLENVLAKLEDNASPDAIFAESVGSCADLVATVVRPLIASESARTHLRSFSVFTDARLLERRLNDQPLPFADNLVYLFDKQIEEAGLLIVNKSDLLGDRLDTLVQLATSRFSDIQVLAQDSRSPDGVDNWLGKISSGDSLTGRVTADLDYDVYGAAEAELAWLNHMVRLAPSDRPVVERVGEIIDRILGELEDAVVGHVKFAIETDVGRYKVSVTTEDRVSWRDQIADVRGATANVLINARVVAGADDLQRIVSDAVDGVRGATAIGDSTEAFHPAYPTPTHRIL